MLGALLSLASHAAAQSPPPDAHFGFRLGTDRRLATADAIESYFTLVASQSDRIKLLDLGKSTGGQVTRMLVQPSGEALWNSVFRLPIDQICATPELRAQLAAIFFSSPSLMCDELSS